MSNSTGHRIPTHGKKLAVPAAATRIIRLSESGEKKLFHARLRDGTKYQNRQFCEEALRKGISGIPHAKGCFYSSGRLSEEVRSFRETRHLKNVTSLLSTSQGLRTASCCEGRKRRQQGSFHDHAVSRGIRACNFLKNIPYPQRWGTHSPA